MRFAVRNAVRVLLVLACSILGGTGPAGAEPPQRMRASVTPSTAQLGERVTYRGRVVFHGGAGPVNIRWLPPEEDDRFTWGAPTPRYVRGMAPSVQGDAARAPSPVSASYDTAFVEIPLQVFDTGGIPIPGLRFEVTEGSRTTEYRLPLVDLPVVPVLTAADSNAALRPLRGPLGAPWWERVPWLWVIAALALVALAWWAWRRLRRRRPAAPLAPAPLAPVLDPVGEALRELAALRRLRLPDAGRFGEHALHLTRILKRFLEMTRGVSRPGDTTPEVVSRLAASGYDPGGVEQLDGLLHRWDRLKFARETADQSDAMASEQSVESLVRRGRADGEGADG